MEDFALVRRTRERGNWTAWLHLCAPSFWGAEEKIGRDFVATHTPVPDFEKVAAAADALTEAAIHRGPFVRFTWGLAFDDRLNQHPEPPPGFSTAVELRADFAPGTSPLYFRVERQTLWGLPEAEAFLFAIRVYIYDARQVCTDPRQKQALRSALQSMSPAARAYKGLAGVMDRLLLWFDLGETGNPTNIFPAAEV